MLILEVGRKDDERLTSMAILYGYRAKNKQINTCFRMFWVSQFYVRKVKQNID